MRAHDFERSRERERALALLKRELFGEKLAFSGGCRMKRESMRTRLPIVILAVVISAAAATIGMNTTAQPVTAERIAGLPRAQQAAWRDYLARSARQMQADRAFLQAELKKAGLKSELMPPSGSSARSMPLNKPVEWYGSAEARRIADIVVSFQTPAGGWSKNINLADHVRKPGEGFAPDNLSTLPGPADFDAPRSPQWHYVGTLDNDATTTEMRFLAKVASASPERAGPYRESFLRGLEYLFAAQYPNGGWPQVWPLEGGYHDAITYNDGAAMKTLELLQDAAGGQSEFGFVPESVRAKANAAVARGIDCILATQIVHEGRRKVWAQQHDALTLQPVAARNYEPPAQSGSESATVVLFLIRQAKPSAAIVEAVHSAAAWLRKTAIAGQAYRNTAEGRRLVPVSGGPPIWARFYEIGTDRPVFGDRDKTIHDDVNEISAERRNGYSWYNSAPQQALDAYEAWSASHPRTTAR